MIQTIRLWFLPVMWIIATIGAIHHILTDKSHYSYPVIMTILLILYLELEREVNSISKDK